MKNNNSSKRSDQNSKWLEIMFDKSRKEDCRKFTYRNHDKSASVLGEAQTVELSFAKQLLKNAKVEVSVKKSKYLELFFIYFAPFHTSVRGCFSRRICPQRPSDGNVTKQLWNAVISVRKLPLVVSLWCVWHPVVKIFCTQTLSKWTPNLVHYKT